MILFQFNPWSCSIQSLNQFLSSLKMRIQILFFAIFFVGTNCGPDRPVAGPNFAPGSVGRIKCNDVGDNMVLVTLSWCHFQILMVRSLYWWLFFGSLIYQTCHKHKVYCLLIISQQHRYDHLMMIFTFLGYQFLLSKKHQQQAAYARARNQLARQRLKDRALAAVAKNQKLQDDLGSE